MPNISMSLKARYVTQSGAYASLLIGKPLTNRTINKWKKKGYFGGEVGEQRKAKIKKKKLSLKAFL